MDQLNTFNTKDIFHYLNKILSVTKEVFDPLYGLFVYSSNKRSV